MNYHVSKSGNDLAKGTQDAPFLTISKAAAIAGPGDTITVHAGIYREWVNPATGGSPHARITYQAAPGESVTITGAEVVTDWVQDGAIWKTTLPNSLFGDYNPYSDIIGGDWFFDNDKDFHTGEVYLNGKSMYESLTLEGVINPVETPNSCDKAFSIYTWYTQVDPEKATTTIWANFHGADPRTGCVEINVRPFVFWPSQTGRGYITVRGFTLKQAATQWAPPTALQTGLIGPHWSRGWIIENNHISDSKNVGISLGKEISTGQNEWTRTGVKGGTQREREVIFRSLRHANWHKDHVGSHIVRNNVIEDCEQAAIVGHLGPAFCTIAGNHINRMHYKRQWHGAEVGGIKLHGAIDTLITDNIIHDSYRGLWLDWQAQGTQVSRNVLYDNSAEDFMVEVCHGPYTVDHNLFLSKWALKDMSTGGAYLHNLFVGKIANCVEHTRYTPYHYPHETAVYGVANILGGDNRFYNNIFVADPTAENPTGLSNFWNGAVIMDGVPGNATFMQSPVGLSQYNDYPTADEPPIEGHSRFEAKLPIYVAGNLYIDGAEAYAKEENPLHDTGITVTILDRATGKVQVDYAKPLPTVELVDTNRLGTSYQAEMAFENPDGSPITYACDFFDNYYTRIVPGPFAQVNEKSSTFVTNQ